ncbi:MAG: hypothetical protein WD100_05850, partial [Tistlia sp.]
MTLQPVRELRRAFRPLERKACDKAAPNAHQQALGEEVGQGGLHVGLAGARARRRLGDEARLADDPVSKQQKAALEPVQTPRLRAGAGAPLDLDEARPQPAGRLLARLAPALDGLRQAQAVTGIGGVGRQVALEEVGDGGRVGVALGDQVAVIAGRPHVLESEALRLVIEG